MIYSKANNLNVLYFSLLSECEVDGDTFINMDLVDLNALTPKLKLRRILRNKWTEITGMVSFFLVEQTTKFTRKTQIIVLKDSSNRAANFLTVYRSKSSLADPLERPLSSHTMFTCTKNAQNEHNNTICTGDGPLEK